MSFTDRFVKLPIQVVNKEQQQRSLNTGERVDAVTSWMKINPFEIAYYFPTCDKDSEPCVNVNLKCGNSVYVYLDVADFERKLNEHSK